MACTRLNRGKQDVEKSHVRGVRTPIFSVTPPKIMVLTKSIGLMLWLLAAICSDMELKRSVKYLKVRDFRKKLLPY